MTKLERYVARANIFKKLLNKPEYNVDTLTETQAQELYSMLDSDLSPENLCMDGEIPQSQVKIRFSLFNGALKELFALGKAKNFKIICL